MITRQSLVWYDTADNRWFEHEKDIGTNSSYYIGIDGVDSTNIKVKARGDSSVVWQNRSRDRYCILEYTKTTD